MDIIELKGENCRSCYKCLRDCPVKAIKMENDRAVIINDLCILCDGCINSCPNNVKFVNSYNVQMIKQLMKTKKVILSVAPSFIANFPVKNFEEFKKASLKIGFYDVEETSVGAYYVTKEYKKDLESGKFKNYITSACPSLVRYIQLYAPKALKYLSPVDSPMIAHAKILKKRYGNDVSVVFVGPCLAKIREAFESPIVDCAITFKQLDEWFQKEKVVFEKVDNVPEEKENKARYYSVTRGIIKSFDSFPKNYEYLAADGIDSIREILENIDQISGVFLEMDMCRFSCVSGPCTVLKVNSGGPIKAVETVRLYAKNKTQFDDSHSDIDFTHSHQTLSSNLKKPTEEQIKAILARIGKTSEKDQQNCRGCGYETCIDKAIAVFNGLADPDFCLPYLQKKAENFSTEIIASSPNGIFTIGEDNLIKAINAKAKEIFNLNINDDYIGKDYRQYFQIEELEAARLLKKVCYNKKIKFEATNKWIQASFIFAEDHQLWIGYIKDITVEELNEQKLKKLRENTIEVTDKVIDKQMRSVQEIASLLGETAAETKIALMKFKESLKDNEE